MTLEPDEITLFHDFHDWFAMIRLRTNGRHDLEGESDSTENDCNVSSDESVDSQSDRDDQEFISSSRMKLAVAMRIRCCQRCFGNLIHHLSNSQRDHRHLNTEKKTKKRKPSFQMNALMTSYDRRSEIFSSIRSRLCTSFLLLSVCVWLFAKASERRLAWRGVSSKLQPQQAAVFNKRVRKLDLAELRKRRARDAKVALGSAAVEPNKEQLSFGEKKKDIEALPPECVPSEWQKLSFPNCNEIHEIDLRIALGLSRIRHNKNNTKQQGPVDSQQIGYVGSGMWRTVWKVHPHGPLLLQPDGTITKPAILKIMKLEHDVDERNLDRHRRDALVMERLTSSPHIIGIYGYCGNTILSEFIGTGLDRVIFGSGDAENITSVTRNTPLGRLRLALGATKGVAALHNIPGGPILHADLQAKQFLVDTNGIVKLNDFNRCRFVAHHNKTKQACPVRIPQAPGAARSPEEYEFKPLNEQIDVYSLGNVFYSILSGHDPWYLLGKKKVKANVKGGKKADLDPKYRREGTSDADLAKLMDRAYEYDPRRRITATKLTQELENLITNAKVQ